MKKTLSLIDLLNEKHDSTLMGVRCDDCHEESPFAEQMILTRLLEYLVCTIGRFANGHEGNKVTEKIRSPVQGLDMRRWAHPSGCVGRHWVYNYVAVLHHRGTTLRAGHYVCHVREGGEWILYNDKVESRVPEGETMVGFSDVTSECDSTDRTKGSNCYMMLYQAPPRQSIRPPHR